MGIWNIKEFETLWKKLKVPKKYENMRCNMKVLAEHDITMNLSIREDSGKTTQALLYALCFRKLWNVRTAYLRADKDQISRGNIEELCDKFLKLPYLDIIFEGEYNYIKYVWNEHKFYLGKKSVIDGEVVVQLDDKPFMYAVCNEDYIKYKSSGFDDDDLNFMIFDEFMDSSRATNRQMIELMNNISTFGRPLTRQYIIDDKDNKYQYQSKPKFRVLMLGNNTQLFSQWFEEFCIEDDVPNLKFGSYIDRTTELGTTFACHLLATSEEFREKRKKNNIPFFGFNTPKMNAFNGIQEWQSESHPHILYEDMINNSKLMTRDFYLLHRNKILQLELRIDEFELPFIFVHKCKTTKDNTIKFTTTPTEKGHVYGFGNYILNEQLKHTCKFIISCIKSNRIFFATNSDGDLFQNYCNEIQKNKNYL